MPQEAFPETGDAIGLTFTEEFIQTRHGVVELPDSPIAVGIATLTGMVDLGRVRAFCEAARQRFRPQKIILFGSYAYGKPTADSDVDLLVIMPRTRELGKRMSVRIQKGKVMYEAGDA